MKDTPKQIRIKKIIDYIHTHPHCSTTNIATELDVTQRTIQTDLKYLREEWQGGRLTSTHGKHNISMTKNLSQIGTNTEQKIYLKLALKLVENLTDLSSEHHTLIDKLNLKDLPSPYYIKPEEYEELNTDKEEIKELDTAIKSDNIIEFVFQGKHYHVEPYRLVNFDGIWYLYGRDIEEQEDNDHKTWLLKEIDDVTVYYNQKHDTTDEEIEQDLENAHSAGFKHDESFEVTLKVSAKVAKMFRRKNYLPKQCSIPQKDGSLLVTSTISTYDDIDPEVKSWLPYIEVLKPLEYREKLHRELEEYLKQIK